MSQLEIKGKEELFDEALSIFVNKMPKATSLEKENIQKQIRNREYSWVFLLLLSCSTLIEQYESKIAFLEAQIDYDTASDETLEIIGDNKNIARLEERGSSVTVYFGVDVLPEAGFPIVIPALTEIGTPEPNQIRFKTDAEVIIDSLTPYNTTLGYYAVCVNCTSAEKGSKTLIDVGEITEMIANITSIDHVYNDEVSQGGRDQEPRISFIQRLKASNESLEKGSVEWWNNEMVQWTYVKKVIPVDGIYGYGTVGVYVSGYPTITPSEKDELTAYYNDASISPPGGWNIVFLDMVNVPFDIHINVYGTLTSGDYALILAKASEYFDLLVDGDDFVRSDFIDYLKQLDGVEDAEVNIPSGRKVSVEPQEIAYLNTLTVDNYYPETV